MKLIYAQPHITVHSFRMLLTQEERTALHGSSDPTCQAFLADLSSASSVDLSAPWVMAGLQRMQDLEILTPERVSEIHG